MFYSLSFLWLSALALFSLYLAVDKVVGLERRGGGDALLLAAWWWCEGGKVLLAREESGLCVYSGWPWCLACPGGRWSVPFWRSSRLSPHPRLLIGCSPICARESSLRISLRKPIGKLARLQTSPDWPTFEFGGYVRRRF